MSLATRCPSCGTVFRVVHDQLKVSEGWVRCGRCNEVFNALEGLFDLQRDTPADWDEPQAAKPARTARAEPAAAPPDRPSERWRQPDPLVIDRIDEQLLSSRRSAFGPLGGQNTGHGTDDDFADARFDSDQPESAPPESDGGSVPAIDLEIPDDANTATEAPEFVLRAEREARWASPRARALLGSGALVMMLALLLQAGHHFRDRWAAQWPALQGPLQAWCDVAGCRIEPPRRIEDIVVESTALARATQPDVFKLSVVLRNRAAMPAATPWVDLSLTDAEGQLVARRALAPKDFPSAAPTLAAASEATLQVLLSAGASRVTGYTVEIFYP